MPVAETTHRLLSSHPDPDDAPEDVVAACVAACADCAAACTGCADACLAEPAVADLVHCIRLDQDCADVCDATGRIAARQTAGDRSVVRAMLRVCIEACQACATECAAHGEHGMEHCAICAEACERCARACATLLDALG